MGQPVDPALQQVGLLHEEAAVAVDVGDHADALPAGEQAAGELPGPSRVAQFGELVGEPVLEEQEHGLGLGLQCGIVLAQFGVERAHGTTVACQWIDAVREDFQEAVQALDGRAVAFAPGLQHLLDAGQAILEGSMKNVFLAFEIVVDIPPRDAGGIDHVGEGGVVIALVVEEPVGCLHDALARAFALFRHRACTRMFLVRHVRGPGFSTVHQNYRPSGQDRIRMIVLGCILQSERKTRKCDRFT